MTVNTRCHELQPVLSAYADHEATAEEIAHVEAHVRTCHDCAAQLKRYQALLPRMESALRADLQHGQVFVERALRTGREPLSMRGMQPRTQFVSRLATVGTLVLIAAVLALTIRRTAPVSQPVQTAAQPTTQAPPGSWRIEADVDGIVDPSVATYIRRVVEVAASERPDAAVVVVLDASAGLDAATRDTVAAIRGSKVPVIAHVKQANATTLAIAAATPWVESDDTLLRSDEVLAMEPLEALWHRLLDPSTAYVLFVLGLYALFAEVAHPGAMIPGISGVVLMSLATVGFVGLPINWIGVMALVGGVTLMGVELKAASRGLLTLAGVTVLIGGSFLLYSPAGSFSPMLTELSVAPPVFGATVLAGLGVGVLFTRVAQRIRALPPVYSLERLIGARGFSRSGLEPEGVVHVQGQLWSARVRGPHVGAGEAVRVVARHGLVLEVESATRRAAATQKGATQ